MLSHSKENQFIWNGNLFHGGTYFLNINISEISNVTRLKIKNELHFT
jgi:hypothetical protein